MALFGSPGGTRRTADMDAARARADTVRAMFTAGAEVSVEAPDEDAPLTYVVDVVGDRSHTSERLAAIVGVLSTGEEPWVLDLGVADDASDGSTYSSVELSSNRVEALGQVLRAHEHLYARLPERTIILDTVDGEYTISDVPPEAAVSAARTVGEWFRSVLTSGSVLAEEATLTVDVGGDGVVADVSYSISTERQHDRAVLRSRTQDDDAWYERVLDAWTDNLALLEVLVGLPVPVHHTAHVTFTDAKLKPRLSVWHHRTLDEDERAAEELVATLRDRVPGSRIKVG